MAEDPDEAIKKLEQYRAESKSTKLELSSDKDFEDSPIRKFFINFYWFNVVIIGTLGFSLLFGGWSAMAPAFVVILILLSFLLMRQTMVTIDRLDETQGRNTTIDDAFVILLIAGMFLIFFPLLDDVISRLTFQIIHIPLVIIWFVQIFFVNYKKPEAGAVKSTGGIVETEETTLTMSEKLIQFFTLNRSIAIGISLVLAIIISLI